MATVTLLNAAVRQEHEVKRFVFTSSIAAFGAVVDPSELPMTELTPQRPEDPYGIAKHSSELDLRAALHMYKQNFIIFRPHNVYGTRQNIADKFRNAIGIFMNQIMRKEPITIFGDGKQTRAFSYIDDVAPVIAASVLFPDAVNEDFFVGTDTPFSVNDLAQRVIKAMNVPGHTIQHLDARKEVEHAYASHDKLRCYFKPNPPTPLDEGLATVAKFVYETGSFEPKGYLNIEVDRNLPPSWKEWLSAAADNKN
jgi:UDP-glucose 4-epimerase